MLKRAIKTTLSVAILSVCLPVYAHSDMSCMVEVAVATPPIQVDEHVAFNVTNEYGFSKSTTVKGGSGPQLIENVPCSTAPLTITATEYATPSNSMLQGSGIGQWTLRAGTVFLSNPENSVSVVFPNDFVRTN